MPRSPHLADDWRFHPDRGASGTAFAPSARRCRTGAEEGGVALLAVTYVFIAVFVAASVGLAFAVAWLVAGNAY